MLKLTLSFAVALGVLLSRGAAIAQTPAASPIPTPSAKSAPTPTPKSAQTPQPKKKVLARKHERPPLYDQFSGQGYGAAGCGLGSIVFGPKPGPIQIAAATLNAIALNQTFGITTGTSNCDIPESAYPAAAFIEVNKETLAKDFSRGEGESISSLAALLKCQNVPLFTSVVRTQVPTLYDTSRPSLELTRSLLHELKVNPSLATTCSLEGV